MEEGKRKHTATFLGFSDGNERVEEVTNKDIGPHLKRARLLHNVAFQLLRFS